MRVARDLFHSLYINYGFFNVVCYLDSALLLFQVFVLLFP